ncbi:uncharacterized protein IWZ02DRAFT_491095 [Phyllosticta citriasiana]|uniref:uncharacterized protein n=1 Tax=Phyllosticta citriasiana TaxID=595635 RepID=UPI0030FDD82C
MAQNQPTRASPEQLSAAYAQVASLEEGITETKGRIQSRLNEIEAERAYLQRRAKDLEEHARQSIELLQNEDEIAKMMEKPASTSSAQSELEVFVEQTSSLVDQVSEQLNKSG